MIEKRKIQKYNRIPMPTAMLSSLNLKEGDDVLLTCDDNRIYLAKKKDQLPKMVALFNTGQGTSNVGLVAPPPGTIPKGHCSKCGEKITGSYYQGNNKVYCIKCNRSVK